MAIGSVSKFYNCRQAKVCDHMVMSIVVGYENRGYKAFIAGAIFRHDYMFSFLPKSNIYMHFIAGVIPSRSYSLL